MTDLRRKKALRIGFVVVLIAGAAAWLLAYERLRLPARFAVVEAGKLYRSSQPSTRQIQRLIDEYHIKTVLIVRSGESDRVPDEKEFCRARGLRVVHIPIETRKAIPESQVQEFFKCIDDSSVAPILIHCSAGRHRTGYLCARYRIERQGWPLEKAIEELLSFGFDAKHESAVLEQIRRFQPKTTSRAGGNQGALRSRDDDRGFYAEAEELYCEGPEIATKTLAASNRARNGRGVRDSL